MAATGSVYIFNTTNQVVKVELNDTDLHDRIPARSGKKEEPEPSYVPAQVRVPRSDATQTPDALFATTNKLEIKFSGVSNVYPTVKIDPGSYWNCARFLLTLRSVMFKDSIVFVV